MKLKTLFGATLLASLATVIVIGCTPTTVVTPDEPTVVHDKPSTSKTVIVNPPAQTPPATHTDTHTNTNTTNPPDTGSSGSTTTTSETGTSSGSSTGTTQ